MFLHCLFILKRFDVFVQVRIYVQCTLFFALLCFALLQPRENSSLILFENIDLEMVLSSPIDFVYHDTHRIYMLMEFASILFLFLFSLTILFITQVKSWQLFPKIKCQLCVFSDIVSCFSFAHSSLSLLTLPFKFMLSKYTKIKNFVCVFFFICTKLR